MDKLMEQCSHQPIAGAIGINIEAELKCTKPEGSNNNERLPEAERIRESARVDDLPFHWWPDEPFMHVYVWPGCLSQGLLLGKLLSHLGRLELIIGHASFKKRIPYLGLSLQGTFD